ncbi:ParB/RepB/Spo0J family partition protein [Pseudoprimorskyibacter insulae]|uniref:Nucleoid occlusion protein n=1 Tax=Pseudoprimorskyibacter insulae TaxID=1695997 RepID=A0A2R8B0J5_9RHOB|nr:ParB N-terminal domain-containing protein [Pseudoprimorskyibacter insulae]SPF81815.1 Nucleoid occlusion protein [Pseudoprimorskyibacter insulae]
MAKRKRLTPPPGDVFGTAPASAPSSAAAGLGARAPISQVAGDVAVNAAFEQVQAELHAAQRDGRMVLQLPLSAVREDHLIRDRMACNADEMTALKDSLRARGQQTPVEVTDLGNGQYGLISGWRRLRALRELADEGGATTVQALLRRPEDRPAAYVAMVEENEIRADLSFYERARIVVQAVQAGVFDSDKAALQSLFSSASFSKRSKVKSFMPLVAAFDGVLRFPEQIPERLGLALSKAVLADDGFVGAVAKTLHADMSAEEERSALEAALRGPKPDAGNRPAPMPAPEPVAPGIRLRARAGRVELDGDGVTDAMIAQLKEWLKQAQ